MPPSDRYREFLETTHYGSPEPLNLQTALAPIAHRFITRAELAAAAQQSGPGRLFTVAEARAAARRHNPSLTKSGEAMCKQIGDRLGVDWKKADLDEFCNGMFVEEEHRDVTGGDPIKTAKIVLAHLRERKDYYTRLDKYVEKALSGAYLLKSHVKGHTRRSKSGAASFVADYERHMAHRGHATPEHIEQVRQHVAAMREYAHGFTGANAKKAVWSPDAQRYVKVTRSDKEFKSADEAFRMANDLHDHWYAALHPEKLPPEDWEIAEKLDMPRAKKKARKA